MTSCSFCVGGFYLIGIKKKVERNGCERGKQDEIKGKKGMDENWVDFIVFIYLFILLILSGWKNKLISWKLDWKKSREMMKVERLFVDTNLFVYLCLVNGKGKNR